MYRSGRCFALSRTAPQASACSGRARSSKGNGIRVSPYRRAIEFWKARGALAWFCAGERVRALGPDNAITASGRIFARLSLAEEIAKQGTT
jgi:hypothetical protein